MAAPAIAALQGDFVLEHGSHARNTLPKEPAPTCSRISKGPQATACVKSGHAIPERWFCLSIRQLGLDGGRRLPQSRAVRHGLDHGGLLAGRERLVHRRTVRDRCHDLYSRRPSSVHASISCASRLSAPATISRWPRRWCFLARLRSPRTGIPYSTRRTTVFRSSSPAGRARRSYRSDGGRADRRFKSEMSGAANRSRESSRSARRG